MSLTYTQITAITERLFLKKLVDNVYGTNAALARMSRPGQLQLKTGGHQVLAPIIKSKPGVGGWYTGLDALDVSASDDITAAQFEWRQLYEPIRISKLDLLKNAGDAQKLSLVASKVKVAEAAIRDNLATGLFGAGGSKTIDGFQALLSTSATYGNVAVADLAEWVAVVKENSGTDRALTLALIQQAFGEASQDSGKPKCMYMNQNVFDQVWGLFQPHQRFISASMSKLGFENVLEVNGVPAIVDSHCKANAIQMIDEENTQLCVFKEENLRKETLEKLETSNSMLMRIFWAGNLVSSSRRTNAELSDISVAA